MNPVPLFLIIVTLPLLLGGCREKKVVTEVRNGLMYIKGSENLYTGEQLLFYENGQMEQRANYKDGKFDGLGTSWHENGEKKEQGHYKDNKLNGLWSSWYKNGQIEQKGNFKDNKPDGLFIGWHENG